jgi:hypothetical protein
VAQYHQDNALQQQMRHAWNTNPILRNLRDNEGRRLDAINLLWDVFEVRRARVGVWVPDNSQTVAWFVAQRDSQFRMEHMARALPAPNYPHPYQQQQQPRAHPAPASLPMSLPMRESWSAAYPAATTAAATPTPAAATGLFRRHRLIYGPARRGVDEGEDDEEEEEEE